jgi:uncharacterized protein YbbK (DUF523 family)
MIIVSACLLGIKCRYDGKSCPAEGFPREGIVPVCPEQLGGLPTPRRPASLEGGDGDAVLEGKARVRDASGADVTENFLKGVEAVLEIVSIVGAERAILKERSPSCGASTTYIDGRLAEGKGVLAAALEKAHVPVVSEKELP